MIFFHIYHIDEATYQRVLKDETAHARTLVALKNLGSSSHVEPWHRGASASDWLRDLVYGFNDGLTANFGLVTGLLVGGKL